MSVEVQVREAYERIAAADRPEVWIALRERDDVLVEARDIDRRVVAGERLPLAGTLAAVKDNIDVEGLPTTAGCRTFSYEPTADAPAVARLRAAGVLVLGKTNLDQFATGLVGTRSPFGAVRNAWRPDRISGGSSSGSAVAVALNFVDIALGTDTAGSGRVPAALNGIFGIKPTVGLVPTTGVVPACRSIDVITVFARDLALGRRAAETMEGPDGVDPLVRTAEQSPALAAAPRIAVPTPEHLEDLAPGWADAFQAAVRRLADAGAEIVEVDISPLLAAAALLYGGAFVAERTAAVGDFIRAHEELIGGDLDPTVSQIILAGERFSAVDAFRDRERLEQLGLEGRRLLAGTAALLTPTTTWHPTLEEVASDPVGANARMGKYTNFANLLDYASLAAPAGTVDGFPFGVMLTGPAFSDRLLADIARRISDMPVEILVVGAHLQGQPLNHQIVACGGRFGRRVRTAATYRLHALATTPPKPGLRRVDADGAAIEGEVWTLPAAGFGAFVAALPQPMTIGGVELEDGSIVPGFLAEPVAFPGASDITSHGGWRAYLAAAR